MNLFLKEKVWWNYVEPDIQELFLEAQELIGFVGTWDREFRDYSFVVFPAAKAYEGSLKKVFLDLGFITEDDYFGKRFRIGKALNPNLEKMYRSESVYDKLVKYCGGKVLADELWNTWIESRNLVFHWFPREKNAVSLPEAEERIVKIIHALDALFASCKIKI
jgi:hypothetical protein